MYKNYVRCSSKRLFVDDVFTAFKLILHRCLKDRRAGDDMAYSPIKDKDKFISEQESRTNARRIEEEERRQKYENDKINKIVREKERAQCDERLEILRAHLDWYNWVDQIASVDAGGKGATVPEKLHPGKRYKRNVDRMKREEKERQKLEEERLEKGDQSAGTIQSHK